MAAKEKLTRKNSGSSAQATMQVNPPPVKVRIPEIKPQVNIPEIKMPEIPAAQVNMDVSPIAEAVSAIGGAIAELAAMQQTLVQQQTEVLNALNKLANKSGVKPPASYNVDFDREDGETVGMTIRTG